MHPKLMQFEKAMATKKLPNVNIGDTVVVSLKITEEGKTRIQDYEGIVIAKKGSGIRTVFTVRRISYGEGVERVLPVYAPTIDKIVVKKKGKTKRAKLYYLRRKVGKKGKIDEKIEKTEGSAAPAPEAQVRKEGE